MDSNWSYLSSGSLFALNSGGALVQETNFNIDLNGDGIVGAFPDLVITGQTASSSVIVGGTVNIAAYTKNNGNVSATSNYVRYWLSDDATLNTSTDRFLGYNSVNTLAVGSSEYDSFSFTYDASWGTGTKYIFFEADGYGYVSESNESNNVAYSAITINGLPDLVIISQYAPSSATVGSTVSISGYTYNQGTAIAGSNYVRYWLSDDATLNTSTDRFLGYNSVNTLAVGSSEYDSFSFTYDASWGTGTKYIFFEADGYGYVSESNESNNVAYSAITINGLPDLVIISQYAPSSATVGSTVSISGYTYNQGTAIAGSNYVRYWLSDDATLNTSTDRFLGYNSVNTLAVGSSEYDSFSFTYDASWGTGTKYIFFEADGYGYVSESNESNNVAYSAITINGLPDLVIISQYAPSSATVGSTVSISGYTYNQGTVIAGSNYVRYWLSDDAVLNTSTDRSLGYNSVNTLAVGSYEYDSFSFTYDASWGTGTKYIFFEADGYGYVSESNESNNVGYSAITINGLADLVIISQYAPSSATIGSTVSISAYTKNNGTATAGFNYVRYWLSDDATLTSTDRFLGYNYVDALAVGFSEYDSFSFTYDASWDTGTKYIFFEADGYGYVSESNESNNVAYTTIVVTQPSSPDLVITGQTATSTVTIGSSVSVGAYTQNNGNASAGANYVRYWLSNDITLDTSTDTSIDYQYVGALNAGSSQYNSLNFTYNSSWGTGTKYILFQADGYGNVTESNESNNVAYATIFVNASTVVPSTYQPFNATQVFSLNSNTSANHTIYLDFDGYTTTNTLWNSEYTNGSNIITLAYDTDGNTSSFSTTELENIWNIWRRVAEDFSPFNVNVTTASPSTSDLIKSGSGDTRWGVRVVIGGNGSWYGGGGGVAYINSFSWDSDTPAFVFSDNFYGSAKNVAEAISHEVGHTLGLNHDGKTGGAEYYEGLNGWASIMGVGYYQELTQWSKGEYSGANNTQDDLAIITGNNGFGYRTDDYGSSLGSASNLSFSGSTVKTYGIIERNTDYDWFTFNSTGGNLILNISAFEVGANLDILAQLYNSSGQLIGTYNPTDSLSATISTYLSTGKYYLSIKGTGKGDLITGYSDYGSLGQYSITATIA
jgi:subtilase family serine protease